MFSSFIENLPLKEWLGPSKAKKISRLASVAEPIIFVNFSLPALLKDALNKALASIKGYEGSVKKVRLHPIKGQLVLEGIRFERKITREDAAPLLDIDQFTLSFQWRSLFTGILAGDVEMTHAVLNWDYGTWPLEIPDPAVRERRTDPDHDWRHQLKSAFPFRLERILLRQGEIQIHHLPGQATDPLRIRDIFAVAKNIANTSSAEISSAATVECRAEVLSGGRLRFGAKGEPFAQPTVFAAALEVREAPVLDLKNLVERHFGVTVAGGTIELFGEATAQDGMLKGYVKPLIEHLNIETAPPRNLAQKIKAAIARSGARLLRNKKTDAIAAKINFEGSLNNPEVKAANAIGNFMRSAFTEAFLPILEHPIRWLWRSAPKEFYYPPRPEERRTIFSLLKTAFQKWRTDEAPQMAASLAYYTSFSLAPLLLMVIAVAGLAFGRDAAQGQLFTQLAGLLGPQSAEAVQSMIAAAWQPSKSLFALAIGAISLVAGATGVLSALKDGLNRVWQTKEEGSLGTLVKERAKFLGMILGIGFLLMVSLAVSAALAALGKYLAGFLPFPEALEHALDLIISTAVISVLFAMIFKYIPDAPVPWRALWAGSVFTAGLFTLGKFVLGLYLGKGTVGSSYGTAGAVLIILLWVYYSGLILYFGAEFTKAFADSLRGHHASR